jgi:hypothetical protein
MGKYIGMDHKEIKCEDAGWIHVVQDRAQWWTLVNPVENLQIS